MVDINININVNVPGFNKLLDYCASGLGAIAAPLLAPWRASQEGKARVNAAEASAKVQIIQAAAENTTSQLIAKEQAKAREYVVPDALEPDELVPIGPDVVQKAVEFQVKKRLTNAREVAIAAAKELGDMEVPNHTPDPDWTARFFDDAQDVSSEELQKLWGKILAGEIKSPGQTSLRTLSILRNMTQREARDFSDLMRFRIGPFVFGQYAFKMLGDNLGSLTIHFSDIGLLYGFGISNKITMDSSGQWVGKQEQCGHALIIEGLPGSQISMSINNNSYSLTSVGQELAKVCQHELDHECLSHFAGFLAEHDYKLKLARIICQDAEGFRVSNTRIIEPFVEPEERD